MKRILKNSPPPLLQAFLQQRPNATWEEFREKKGRAKQVEKQLRRDQRQLCAYCEIELLPREVNGTKKTVKDFQVEHFHPKSDKSAAHNWSLDWQNLLGACLGGTHPQVANSGERHAENNNEHHCGAPKADHDWTADILNPLQLPAFPRLFSYNIDGEIAVDQTSCPASLQNKAQASIDRLNLNSKILCDLRKGVIDGLLDTIAARADTASIAEEIAQAHFEQLEAAAWPAFFTCIRHFLGPAAEGVLQRQHYNG